MALSRRSFVRALGIGGASTLVAPAWVTARGREALAGSGFDALEAGAQEGPGPVAIRLSSNENPNGPPPAVLQAMRDAFAEASRYPGVRTPMLQQAIARHHRVAEDHVLLGCGSGEILRMTTLAAVAAGKPLVTATPTFEDPINYARGLGAEVVEIPVDAKLRIDLQQLADRAPGAGLVFFCNPNNPTGRVHGAAEVKAFVAAITANSQATILIDEAYHEYVEDPAYGTALPLALDNPRVIVVRTFSKVYGLAGVRAGYAIGRPEALAPLRRHRLGNAVSVLAAAAGVAALSEAGHVERERRLNREAMSLTRAVFEGAGYPCEATHTNFVMVDVRRDARTFIDACRRERVLIGRLFPALPTHARISIGTLAEMRAASEVFKRALSLTAAGGNIPG